MGGFYYNEHVEIGKQSSLKKKWEYPLRVQVSLFVKKNIKYCPNMRYSVKDSTIVSWAVRAGSIPDIANFINKERKKIKLEYFTK